MEYTETVKIGPNVSHGGIGVKGCTEFVGSMQVETKGSTKGHDPPRQDRDFEIRLLGKGGCRGQ